MTGFKTRKQSFRLFCALSILLAFSSRLYFVLTTGPVKPLYSANIDPSSGEEQNDEESDAQKSESKEILFHSENIRQFVINSAVPSKYILLKISSLALSVPTQPPKAV